VDVGTSACTCDGSKEEAGGFAEPRKPSRVSDAVKYEHDWLYQLNGSHHGHAADGHPPYYIKRATAIL
jgi:hypothetical protein